MSNEEKMEIIEMFKIRFFCELNDRVCRPIFAFNKKLEPKFTISEIHNIFDETVEGFEHVQEAYARLANQTPTSKWEEDYDESTESESDIDKILMEAIINLDFER